MLPRPLGEVELRTSVHSSNIVPTAQNFVDARFGRFANFDFSTAVIFCWEITQSGNIFGFGNQFSIIFGRFGRSWAGFDLEICVLEVL